MLEGATMKQLTLICAVLSLCATAAFALPTVGSINETTVLSALLSGDEIGPGAALTFTGGATGGYQVPTADIQTGISATIDRSELEVARTPSIRVLAGVTKDLEVGVGYEDVSLNTGLFGADEDQTISTWNINAKYALPIPVETAAFALGANYNSYNLGSIAPDANALNIYLAGTMPLPGDAKASANITYTTVDVDDVTLDDDNDIAFGLGYEKAFSNNTVAGAELILSAGDLLVDSAEGISYANIYVNFPINEKMTGRAALSGIGKFTTTNVGMSYAF
jgi:hypothetical protein